MGSALQKHRLPLLLLGIIALLAGVWAGLVRAGWHWSMWQPQLAAAHGPLMVSGFLGSVIGLERTVALNLLLKPTVWQRRLLLLGPLSAGAGGLLLVGGWGGETAVWLLWSSSAAMTAMKARKVREAEP